MRAYHRNQIKVSFFTLIWEHNIQSLEFINYAKNKGIKQSFSKKGWPYDDSSIESFHATLKKEEVYSFKYFDYDTARIKLFEYIEGWYNRKRIHGSINFMTPNEYEVLSRAN